MKISRYTIIGILFLIISILIFYSNNLDVFIRPVTQWILMGSSKGKDILFFALFGILIIFSQLLSNKNYENNSYSSKRYRKSKINSIRCKSSIINKLYKKCSISRKSSDFYLKLLIILFSITIVFGLILEIILRLNYNIGIFTIFVSMVPDATTTSLIHSHIFKAVLGNIITSAISNVPSGIHTGNSLYGNIPQIANLIVILMIILFVLTLLSLKNRLAPTRIILLLAGTCGLIGVIDGGFFAVPTIIGIYGFLFVYFDGDFIDYIFGKIFKNKKIINETYKKIYYYIEIARENPIFKNKKRIIIDLKRSIPHLILILIIILRISISILGTNPEYYEINLINHVNDLNENKISNIPNYLNNSYQVVSSNNINNNTEIKIASDYNEMELLNSLIKSLKNRTDAFSMSWNFYSYI
ncbi:hypothetical protein [Methanobrevibacter filiformis]|uniref:Uncharacterized protein n=1 Tax=Methanobrevibacter filiformis TaxID=55758 RepID=A0A166F827_9EURY|nr:hypothetical protein [Methanobrevibacter filiformis]KZX17415.1 hypothetical protein MBFIL_01930 [Methanobrevibacter filiformis]